MIERDDWLCMGGTRCRMNGILRFAVSAWLEVLRAVVPGRLVARRWIRYRIDLANALPPPPDVHLQRATDGLILFLLGHPDREQNQLKSGIRFWELGFRRAYAWVAEEGPLCIQWLMLPKDNPRLRRLGEWAGMYPPLPEGIGRVENLFAFSNVRRKGVATQFELALFETARRAGVKHMVTHIYEDNVSANRWAERMEWQRYGTITRYQLDVPGLRALSVFVHASAPAVAAAPSAHALVPSHAPRGAVSA